MRAVLIAIAALWTASSCAGATNEETSGAAQDVGRTQDVGRSEAVDVGGAGPRENPSEIRRARDTGDMCGGIVGAQCAAATDYCRLPAGVCLAVADAAGVCAPRPEACGMAYIPVCGCDEKTYSNACVAASAGVNVAREGPCEDEPT